MDYRGGEVIVLPLYRSRRCPISHCEMTGLVEQIATLFSASVHHSLQSTVNSPAFTFPTFFSLSILLFRLRADNQAGYLHSELLE